MHKYQPRIHLVLRREGAINAPITDLDQEEFKTFIFPECVFTAVTAYQNQLVSRQLWDQLTRLFAMFFLLLSFDF